jgi:uncharacterized protein YjlB
VDEPMQETEVQEYLFEDDGRIPNNPTLPLSADSALVEVAGSLGTLTQKRRMG